MSTSVLAALVVSYLVLGLIIGGEVGSRQNKIDVGWVIFIFLYTWPLALIILLLIRLRKNHRDRRNV